MAREKFDSEQLTDRDQSDVLLPTGDEDSCCGIQLATNSGREIRHEVKINAAPTTLWALLTDARLMMRWLAWDVKADPRPEGIFRITDFSGRWIEGIFLDVDPPQTVAFTWGGIEGLKPGQSTVVVKLHPDNNGTLVRIRHFRLSQAAVEMHGLWWKKWGLPKLKAVAEGGEPGITCLSEMAEWYEQHAYSAPRC
jgi:uncharacterized protein YndB with AHSA1/START domain